MTEIKPMAFPGTHEKILKVLGKRVPPKLKILDLGAGRGAFTKKLHDMDYDVYACDLFPEIFELSSVDCRKVDITSVFPYEDEFFDAVVAIEVVEHITDHQNFFGEINRILKPHGLLFITTPNIMSIKSRLKFLKTGFFYQFFPIDVRNSDGLQHICSRTLDQYNYIALHNNFGRAEVEVDKFQRTSVGFYILLYPVLFLFRFRKNDKLNKLHNDLKLLLGRLLFLTFTKAKSGSRCGDS